MTCAQCNRPLQNDPPMSYTLADGSTEYVCGVDCLLNALADGDGEDAEGESE